MKQRMAVAMMMAMISSGAMLHAQTGTTTAPVKFTDDLFAGTEKFAKNAVSATEVTMDPQTLGLVDGKDKDKARSTKLSVVRTYTYDKPGMYDMAEVEVYRNKLNTGDWHCSVRTRDLKTGSSSDICNRTRPDGLFESAIMTVDPKSLTFIHTIKNKPSSSYGWNGGSGWNNDSDLTELRLLGPEMSAEMAIQKAEMTAEMATMRAGMGAGLVGLQPLVGIDAHALIQQLKGIQPVVPPVPPAPSALPAPPAPPVLP